MLGSWPYTVSPVAIRILSWNCRSLGKSSAVLQVQKIAQDYNLDVMFLMETHLASNKGKDIWNKCGFFYGYEVPRLGLGEGLILAWMQRSYLRVVHESPHLIHIDVVDNKGKPLSITFVYGHPELAKRNEVWQQLKTLKDIAQPSWLCIEDSS